MPEYKHSLSSKLPRVSTTIFSVMSKLAVENNAINLSQGFPNFDMDPVLSEMVNKHMKSGLNQYAPMPGIISLRETLAETFEVRYGLTYDPESEITITAGATQGLFTAITATLQEEDEVIVFTPAYDSYVPAIELSRAKPIFHQLEGPDYRIDWEEVKRNFSRRTKMIIVNTPHNPTGSVFDADDLVQLAKLTRDSDCIILSDEVYEHILLDGEIHHSVASHPELINRSFVVGSFGKTFHCTGWKMGYVCAPKQLMAEFRKVHQYNVFSCNTPIQYALADYLKQGYEMKSVGEMYTKKHQRFLNGIKDTKFTFTPSKGSYFQLLNYSAITKLDDVELAKEWTINHGIAGIPVSVFYNQPLDLKVLRFCFAKDDETIDKATEILRRIGS